METSKNLYKELESTEKLFSDGSIKIAQKKLRLIINEIKSLKKVPNKLRHKLNFSLAQSRYYDDISSFATDPKRNQLIDKIKKLIDKPHKNPKSQAQKIHSIQAKWQLLDHSSKTANKGQWEEFNELTNKAWEPCKEYFDEMDKIKENNEKKRQEIILNINNFILNNSKNYPKNYDLINYLRSTFDEWQKYAPVKDSTFNKLRKEFYDARKKIHAIIEKREKATVVEKESIIEKAKLINGDDSSENITEFTKLKNEWKKLPSAGKKNDQKLWTSFNKIGDKLYESRNISISKLIKDSKIIVKNFKENKISYKDCINEINNLGIKKNKQTLSIFNEIESISNTKKESKHKEKISFYKSIYAQLLEGTMDEKIDKNKELKKVFDIAINNKGPNTDKLTEICVTLEVLSGIDSLKKDTEVKNKVQLSLLTNKFNTSTNNQKPEELIFEFIKNSSAKKSTSVEKRLWSRVEKCIDKLI